MAALAALAEQVAAKRGLEKSLFPAPELAYDRLRDPSNYEFASCYLREDGSRRGMSNWLLRDVVMIGRYPFCDPTPGGPTAEEGRAHLRRVLEAGVSTFVCMQDELPPPGGEPWPAEGVRHEAGSIRGAFLNYAEAAREEASALGLRPPKLLHFPVVDMDVPTWDQLMRIMDVLLRELREGGSLYVHCWGGMGRAATVGACLLAALRPHYGPEEVLISTQAAYDSREGGRGFQSPQTWQQRAIVRNFVVLCRTAANKRAASGPASAL